MQQQVLLLDVQKTSPTRPPHISAMVFYTLTTNASYRLLQTLVPYTHSIPYKFTLLSNRVLRHHSICRFLYTINLHYSQTTQQLVVSDSEFLYPINLHYSQTRRSTTPPPTPFLYPINLHYSQTPCHHMLLRIQFLYPINLHYSQTYSRRAA